MPDLSVDEMEAILCEHEIREASLNLEWTMETVVDNPHYEFPTAQLAVDGQDAVGVYYQRAISVAVDRNAASRKRVHGAGPNTLFREATFSFDAADGIRRTGQYVIVIEFDPETKKIVGQRQYGDIYYAQFVELTVGAAGTEGPGVSTLNDRTQPVTREEMLAEAEAGRAAPGAQPASA